jgi:hypothetical protein
MVLRVSTGYCPKYLELVRLYNVTQMNFSFQRGGITIQRRQTESSGSNTPTPPSSCHSAPDSNLPYIPPHPHMLFMYKNIGIVSHVVRIGC